jgi:hypothetical protein
MSDAHGSRLTSHDKTLVYHSNSISHLCSLLNQMQMKFATKVIHAGIEPDQSTGAIMTPIFQAAGKRVCLAEALLGRRHGCFYFRSSNLPASAV